MLDSNKIFSDNPTENLGTSLTKIGGLSGAPEGSPVKDFAYGAQFEDIPWPHTGNYDRVITVRVDPKWAAQPFETTFMNVLKARNEDPVPTYRNMEMSPIPAEQYEKYEPIIYTADEPTLCNKKVVEGFEPRSSTQLDVRSKTDTDVGVALMFKFMLISAALFVLYVIFKQKKSS